MRLCLAHLAVSGINPATCADASTSIVTAAVAAANNAALVHVLTETVSVPYLHKFPQALVKLSLCCYHHCHRLLSIHLPTAATAAAVVQVLKVAKSVPGLRESFKREWMLGRRLNAVARQVPELSCIIHTGG